MKDSIKRAQSRGDSGFARVLTILALLCMTATGAWAETETITTAADLWQGAKTFTGTNVTVSVQNGGNTDGSYVSVTNTMDISVTGDNIITGLVLTIGLSSGSAGYMLAQPGQCTVSGSGNHSTFVTVTDINASSVTMKMDDYAVYVEKVEVTYANPYTPTPVAGQTNQWKFLMPVYDVELQVEYYPGMFTLGGDAIEGGTVEVVGLTGDALPAGFEKDAEGNIYVAQGTTFTVKATPEEGYHFVCWSDDQTNTNPEREITMPADGSDLSLTATFAENEYDITFSEGTNPDPEHPEWTAAPNPAKTKQTVTVTYSGTKKVIGVKAEKKAAGPKAAAQATAEDKDKLICTEGHIHAYGEDAECTAARVAKIIYIGPTGHATYSHGLALALNDETSTMQWQNAINACNNKNTSNPVTGATWLLASKDQWDYMRDTNGAGSWSNLMNGFTSVGGSDLQSSGYWTSTPTAGTDVWYYDFYDTMSLTEEKSYYFYVRACLAF